MMDELKCKCGETPARVTVARQNRTSHRIACDNCGIATMFYPTAEEAEAAWQNIVNGTVQPGRK